jgi:hypothetical protein
MKGGYYNKTIHKCILKLHLPLEIINKIYENLKMKNEVSGVFYFDNNDNVTHVDKNEGDAGSVYTPNNVINYHTHPINAYRDGKTAFGSPSGEDYRETLKFAMAGNKAHLVFTVEGLYTIQVNPCKIKKIKELCNDTERGILIFLIEQYMKTTHDFRCVNELNDLYETNININPYSFVDFANTFDIPNLLTDKQYTFRDSINIDIHKIGHTGINSPENKKLYTRIENIPTSKIPNMGFPSVAGDYIITMPANKTLGKDDLEDLRKIDANGNEYSADPIKINEIIVKIKEIAKKFDSVPCSIEWNSKPNTWFFVNFFPTKHFINETHKMNGRFSMPKPDTDELVLPHEPFIRIFSNASTGCKVTKIAKTHNFNMGRKFSFNGEFKHRNHTFGKIPMLRRVVSDILYLTNVSSSRHS